MKILSLKEVRAITSLSASTIWRLERSGKFPVRRQVSSNRVGWISEEITQFVADSARGRVAPQSEDAR